MVINIGILIYKDVQPLDAIGPWEVFSFWKNILKEPVNMCLISEKKGYIECDNNIVLKSHCDFESSPQLDYLIIPGGRGRSIQSKNKNLLSFIRNQSKKCKTVLSVCTGMFLLYHAGLLKGKSATTYWRAMPEMNDFDQVKLIEKRIVKSGNIWSSGGVSSGIDLALELIKAVSGKKIAGQVQLLLEYFPQTKLYCGKNTAETLPLYNNQISHSLSSKLPKYIRNHLHNKTKK